MLVIDTSFFFVVSHAGILVILPLTKSQELITGYIVGSLALVADSFHMLKYAYPSPSLLVTDLL